MNQGGLGATFYKVEIFSIVRMDALEIERAAITGLLLYGAATTWWCPCGNSVSGEGLLSCHIPEIAIAIGGAGLLVLYANRNTFSREKY
jgi:hypothetical protein